MENYNRKLGGGAIAVLGAYLIIEHLIVWKALNFWDIGGHEQWGLLSLFIGVLMLFDFTYPQWLKDKNKNKLDKLTGNG